MWLWSLGIAFILLRLLWEYLFPITPSTFKGMIYLRDYLTLGPAGILIFLGLLRQFEPSYAFQKVSISRKWFYGMALAFALIIASACASVSIYIYKTHALVVDEVIYLFQAKIFAAGRLTAPAPADPAFFRVPYTAIFEDNWFGIFFPGQSFALLIGLLADHLPYLINPVLSGFLVLLTMVIAKKWFDSSTAVVAGLLCLVSPFLLFQGASYFSHILSGIFFLISVFLLLELPSTKSLWHPFALGISLGIQGLTRPMSAVVVCLFGVFWCLYQLQMKAISLRMILKWAGMGLLGLVPVCIFYPVYNHQLVGNALLFPHNYVGASEDFSLANFAKNSFLNLTAISVDFAGAPILSLIPFVLFLVSSHRMAKPILALVITNFVCYSLYWHHGISYGPRFHFELLPFFCMGSAYWLLNSQETFEKLFRYFQSPAKTMPNPPSNPSSNASADSSSNIRFPKIVLALIASNLLIGLIGIDISRMAIFSKKADFYNIGPAIEREVIIPALVFIKSSEIEETRDKAIPYLAGFQLNDIYLSGEIVYAKDLGNKNFELVKTYPGYHYYTFDLFKKELLPLERR